MMPERFRFVVLLFIFNFLTVSLSLNSWAREACENWVGKIVSIQGSVEALRSGETHWNPVRLNDTYCIGDIIRVQKNSRAAITLINGATLRLDQESTINFSHVEKKQTLLLKLLKGAAEFFSRFPRTLKLATPFVNGGVEGTEFFVKVDEKKTFISIYEGKVLVSNAQGSLTLHSGQSAIAEAGKPPVLRVVVHPRDAVNWALYYPPVVYRKVPGKDTNDPQFWVYRAETLLSVGRVDEASADIERAIHLNPNFSDAFALYSIISVVQNKKEKALNYANKAVETGPKSATARIALSYAQQASFNLEGARASLEEAVKLAPENALVWARLAELRTSFGDLDKALEAAKRAVALDPKLSRTQSVLGFVFLAQIKIKESKKAFEKAIELDQAAALPRLGLGLSKIREGNLEDGGKEIEIAASLDPNNSLIRSYLGKVYYEEKRTKLDGREYATAKELDPEDPTPWFYDAIREQSINRPVEALHDLQKAIELNDYRAVYRSRLLLDGDLASRSANLARIYDDLGFQQRALVEGWRSVNTDPSNYSAHRFLADSYAVLPRHEVARVSELLQSQLLQPINITPIQPQLAQSSLSILEGAGPSSPSFNEFNPLFQRNRMALQADTVAGGKDTQGNDLVFSGVYGKASFSAGQFHYETEGFRENNDQKQDIYNVFSQVSLSYKTSIQTEIRSLDVKKGDLPLRFDINNFTPTLRQNERIKSLRLGINHEFTPRSKIIASLIYQNADLVSDVIPGFFEIKSDLDHYIGDVRYFYRSKSFNITSGMGHRRIYETEVTTFMGIPSEQDLEPKFTNIYLYSQLEFPKNVNLTIGASADFLDGSTEQEDKNQFNPKIGITWNPIPPTTIRAAVFRTLQRPMLSQENSDPTLEPTQVAGFNQFYFGAEGEDAWRYGVAVDQQFSKNIYAGAELSLRDLETVIINDSGPSADVLHRDWKETMGRTYLYWAPCSSLALSAEYLYERFERERAGGFTGVEQFAELKTHRVPLGIRYFHPSGLYAGFKATYVKQDGDFTVFQGSGFSIVPGDDEFWVVDALIGFRIPKRFGLITLEAKNLFDEEFNFQDTDPGNPQIFPGRLVLFKITLSF